MVWEQLLVPGVAVQRRWIQRGGFIHLNFVGAACSVGMFHVLDVHGRISGGTFYPLVLWNPEHDARIIDGCPLFLNIERTVIVFCLIEGL